MTDDQLASALAPIRERERAATPGPWRVEREHLHDLDDAPFSIPSVTGPDGEDILLGGVDQPGADLRFTADAREDVPRLLAALDAVLELHAPTASTRYTEACPAHYASMFGRLECPDCVKVERAGCQTCRDEYGNPAKPEDCKERAAVLAALTGKETDGNG